MGGHCENSFCSLIFTSQTFVLYLPSISIERFVEEQIEDKFLPASPRQLWS